MTLFSWFGSEARNRRPAPSRPRNFRPALEELQGRLVPTVNIYGPLTQGVSLDAKDNNGTELVSFGGNAGQEYHAQVYNLPGITATVKADPQNPRGFHVMGHGTYTGKPGAVPDAEVYVTGPFDSANRTYTVLEAKGAYVNPGQGDTFNAGNTNPGTSDPGPGGNGPAPIGNTGQPAPGPQSGGGGKVLQGGVRQDGSGGGSTYGGGNGGDAFGDGGTPPGPTPGPLRGFGTTAWQYSGVTFTYNGGHQGYSFGAQLLGFLQGQYPDTPPEQLQNYVNGLGARINAAVLQAGHRLSKEPLPPHHLHGRSTASGTVYAEPDGQGGYNVHVSVVGGSKWPLWPPRRRGMPPPRRAPRHNAAAALLPLCGRGGCTILAALPMKRPSRPLAARPPNPT